MFPLAITAIAWVAGVYRLEHYPLAGILSVAGLMALLTTGYVYYVGWGFNLPLTPIYAAAMLALIVLLVRYEFARSSGAHDRFLLPIQLQPQLRVQLEALCNDLQWIATYDKGPIGNKAVEWDKRLRHLLQENAYGHDSVASEVKNFLRLHAVTLDKAKIWFPNFR